MNKLRLLAICLILPAALFVKSFAFVSTASAVGDYSDAPFCIPTTGYVAQLYHSGHKAIDIGKGTGKGPAIYAPYSGEIIYVGWGFAWEGNYPDIYPKHTVIINHGKVNGKYTASLFAHMGANGDPSKKIKPVSYIAPGILDGTLKTVSMGTLLGYQGTAGVATGTHIHFAIAVKVSSTPFTSFASFWTTGSLVDPKDFIVGSSPLSKWDYLETNCPRLIRPRGGTSIYFLEDGVRRWVPDPPTLHALFPNPSIQDLDPAQVNAFPRGPDIPSIFSGHYLLRAKGTTPIYFIEHGERRWVPDPPTLHTLFPNKPLLDIDPAVLNSIPRGPNIPSIFSGPYLLRPLGEPPVYFVEDGARRWVPDPPTLHALFPNWPIYSVGWEVLSAIRQLPAIPSITVGPQISISFLAASSADGWFSSDVSLVVSGSSPYGTSQVVWQIEPREDGDWKYLQASGDSATLPPISEDGVHSIRYNVSNGYGYWGSEQVITIKIDKTPPSTELLYDGPSYENKEGELFVSPETQFSLEAEDNLSGVAETEYQSYLAEEGEGEGEIYKEPFSLEGADGDYAINYHSTDVAGNVEPENSQEVYFDSTPPISTDDSDGEWHNEDVAVLIVSSDGEGSGVKAIYHGGAKEGIAEGDQVVVIFEEEGVNELSYYAVDNVENIEGEKHAALIKIDKTPPEIAGAPLTGPNKNVWYSEDVIVHFEAGDQLDLSGLKSVTPDTIISTEGKDQEVTGTAEDNAGNTATATVGPINIDKTDPSSEITFPKEGEYYNAESWEGEMRGIARDNLSGIENVEVGVEGIEEGEAQLEDYGEVETGWEYPLEFARDGSDDGYYTARSQATDLAGSRESTAEVNFVYDNTPPTSEITDVEDRYINEEELDEGVGLSFTAEDNVELEHARLYKRYEGEGGWNYHSWRDVSGVSDQGEFGVQILKLPNDPKEAESREGLWEFSSSAKDRAKNCENQENCQGPLEVEEADTWIIYDITAPASAIASIEEGAYYNAETWPGISGTADDINIANPSIETSGVTWVEVQVVKDSTVVVDWTKAKDTDDWSFGGFPFEDGEYTVYSQATDRADNRESTFEVSFVYDATPPVTSVELSGTEGLNNWYISPVTLTLNPFDQTSGIKRTGLTVMKGGEGHYHTLQYDSENPFLFEEDGTYVARFWSEDLAGNVEQEQEIIFKIDTVAPQVPAASIPGGTLTEGEILKVSLTAEEGAKIYFSLNGGAFTLYSDPIAITDDATLSAYAEDEAGNRSELVEFNYTFNPVPQVLGIQSQETPGVSRGEGEVKGEEIAVTTESDDPNPKGLGGWLILLAVLIGGVPYLLFRWRIFLRR